ncbi:RNA polymerase II-associated, Paf1 [Cordyceps militaris CM01]|uniref:RNA polymerase II-associated, Paf1 n=2 Tax=Cordyceps militaris TaxID=73501 RepID=G3J5A3_CORMM|nr:RNA polymerase II-associated, Paf1 [Cordyceps militaris CM01]ATY64185.1 RNA polymerase II-Paf1 [Cordyceps militaris]EGX96813.1 RNA polymerase II-associated, Paf1 [Cordyceps militaris CM01]
MSASAPRSGERVIHTQDFIARIRYSNALPPPPNPPKLLDIPNTGLSSGQYTTPGFASRLAREQPLNIEADAELGMPLDLVGMPGVFDGDESSIQASAQAPPVHPHDKPLLRPIAALGKPKVAEANVSFLRRTEYISSLATKRFEGNSPRALLMKAKRPLPRQAEAAADAPQTIKRKIERSFDVAEQEAQDPKRARHPTKKHLKAVEVTPLLPDLDAFPDSGAYVTIKFLTNPMAGAGSKYDPRLLSSLFRPIDKTREEEALYEAALAAHEADPVGHAKPQNLMNYDFYLGDGPAVGKNFGRKFDVDDPEHDEDALYTDRAGGCFQFNRVRAYETAQEIELDHLTKYQDEVLLAFNDDESYPRQRAVYYYPVMQKSTIRPQRTKNIARTAGIYEEEQTVDQLDITVEDPTEEMRDAMKRYRAQPLGWEQEAEEEEEELVPQEEEEEEEEPLVEQPEEDADAEETTTRHRSPEEEEEADADADEDED